MEGYLCGISELTCISFNKKKNEIKGEVRRKITHYIHTQAQKKNKKLVRINQTYTSQVDFSRELKLAAANSTAPGYFGCQPALTGWLTAKWLMLDVCGCPGPAPVLTGELHYPRQIVSQMWANIYYRLAG